MWALPSVSIAAQNCAVAHDTEAMLAPVPVEDQFVPSYVSALPLPPTARQKLVLTHDTPVSENGASTATGADQLVPLKVSARPALSTATQKLASVHDTDANPLPESMFKGAVQFVPL
jgi:hypothetical protein